MDLEEQAAGTLYVLILYIIACIAVLITVLAYRLATGEVKPCSATATQGN